MKWEIKDTTKLPIKSWCETVEPGAMEQARNLADHPAVYSHVALMPDCHVGYGMPIGGVIACDNAVIPNAVGVDIGCGMCAVQTNVPDGSLKEKHEIRHILDDVKRMVPVGEGYAHKEEKRWEGFSLFLEELGIEEDIGNNSDPGRPEWLDRHGWTLAAKNLGTLGGGNHFIELQKGDDGFIWLMLHSGSRNLGYRIASYYHKLAVSLNDKKHIKLPSADLAFFYNDSEEGMAYVRDMNFALNYAFENRQRMMACFKKAFTSHFPEAVFEKEVNIHHNYAAVETHFGKELMVHRKGATSAREGELGIIPGSMGTPSYIVKGLGNPHSFMSCSHGAGRVMGRMEACRKLTVEQCNRVMGDVVFDRWGKVRARKKAKGLYDLGESPLAYKNIDTVIESEMDLIEPLVKLYPLGVVKG